MKTWEEYVLSNGNVSSNPFNAMPKRLAENLQVSSSSQHFQQQIWKKRLELLRHLAHFTTKTFFLPGNLPMSGCVVKASKAACLTLGASSLNKSGRLSMTSVAPIAAMHSHAFLGSEKRPPKDVQKPPDCQIARFQQSQPPFFPSKQRTPPEKKRPKGAFNPMMGNRIP